MGKIGFINICHGDYVNASALGMAERAVQALREAGADVLAEGPAMDVRGAERAARLLVRSEVDGVILFLGTWMECPVAMAALREVEHLPLCLWGFPMFTENGSLNSTGSYVSFAMFKGTMERAGYRCKYVLGMPGDPETTAAAADFCTAAACAARLKRTRIGLVGYTSMGIYPGTFDHVFLRVKIGPEVEQMDSYTLINMAQAAAPEDVAEAAERLGRRAAFAPDVTAGDLEKVARLAAALLQFARQKDLQGVNVKCQYEFSKEYGMVMCVPLSVFADFGFVSSCEGDMMNTVSMTALRYLAGADVAYGDVIHHGDGVVKLSSCGFMPFGMGGDCDRTVRRFMPHPGFRGIQNSFSPRPGRVTVLRLVEDRCDYHFLCMTGEGLQTELRQGYMPALDVRPDGGVEPFVEQYAGQHFAFCYGDYTGPIKDLARILGIGFVKV